MMIWYVAAPSISVMPHVPAFPEPPSHGDTGHGSRVQLGDYNPRPKAWQPPTPGDSYSCPASMSASWASSDFDAYQNQLNGYGDSGVYSPHDQYLPACDL
ncbi:hypothetical protein BaRGS_00033558 [Batillaria attramentaria]|uniref:Uncharacterized protein n=1 Tax=Batillaria attramentaria TaxID=370345 RepID=A0ABD0JL26_9CAEN